MEKINSYYELDGELNKYNLNRVLDDIMLFKIKTDARSCGEVIEKAVKLLKKHLRQEEKE